jgi:hypothetical protein
MKPETDPITDDEYLLRLVWHDRFTAKVPVISPTAFEPRVKGDHPDTDGLSMFREACLTAPSDALAVIAEDKRARNGIVRIPVVRLTELGLTVRPSPIDAVPGQVEQGVLHEDATAARRDRQREHRASARHRVSRRRS